jgi:hypothetical protein
MLICDQIAVFIVQTADAPLPPDEEPTEEEAQQYLEVLKDATVNVQMYFPQARAESGLAVFQELAKRNASR